MKRLLAIIVLAVMAGTLHAQEPEASGGGFLEVPTVVPSPVTGEAVEPDITIREDGDAVVYEYRVRGALYMVKVQPQVGPPYYLFDTDGDGVMDAQDNSPDNLAVPQWVLFRWD
ncbi:hypothetical protein MARPU_12715 [Marichromatium purpuratum 984]|uniref:DUF2782 domain-containing protein n=1 Tax=Marichromatium purpuratum 984 TaxID=765910 RepID=W0E4Y6_MARPU|nr:DUF2782 domain-containing protein [Marichromatium purpuratum]AHF04608.1 hypothetical protein MARPU_12715 [Marichromatium purpuratum 984]